MNFPSTGELPADKVEARRVKYKAAKYYLMDGLLYKRGHTLPYFLCVHPTQVSNLLYEIHQGTCGNHIGGRALSRKALL